MSRSRSKRKSRKRRRGRGLAGDFVADDGGGFFLGVDVGEF